MTATGLQRIARMPGQVVTFLVIGYQKVVSPLTAPRCRFYPSCSAYAVTALRRHGLIRGGALAVWRLARCQPFNPGGVDHVPPAGEAFGRRMVGRTTHGMV